MDSQNDEDFVLEDDVLKGQESALDLVSLNFGHILLDAFDKNPNHVSQIDAATGNKTTHAEMKYNSIRCALWMESQGIRHEDVIALFTHSQLDAYIPAFATYFVQAVMNPWRWDLTSDQARDWLLLYEPKLIFIRVEAADAIEEALLLAKMSVKIVVFGEHPRYTSLNEIMRSQSSIDVENYRPSSRKSPRELATIINSSGTTGQPKGVMISAEALLRNALDPKLQLRGKKVLWYSSPSGIMCNNLMLMCIFQNATRIISNSMGPQEVCRVIEEFEVNYAQVSPTLLNPLADFKEIDRYNLDCLEVMRTSGTKLNRVTFDKLRSSCLRDKIFQGYGTTEIGAMGLHPKYDRHQQSHNSIGFVSSNLQLKIIHRLTKNSLGANSLGEILIKTLTMMLGYYKNPIATRKAFDTKGWYHTGDLGYYDKTGEIFIMGRIMDAFEYRGREFFTTEIEDVLWEHPAVCNLTVVPVPSESVGRVPVAFLVMQPGESVTENEMIELLKTSDNYQTLPLKVQFIDKMPVTPSLKVAKGKLIELALMSISAHS